MGKDAYWFYHDSNARNDPKMCRLLMVGGQAAKGCFWDLVEILRESDGYQIALDDLDGIAFACRFPDGVVDQIVECGLLVKNDTHIWSDSLIKRMERYETYCESRRAAASKGGKAKAANAKHKPSTCLPHAKHTPSTTLAKGLEGIGSERKGEKSVRKRTAYSEEFEQWWKTYPRGENKRGAYKAFGKARKEVGIHLLLSAVERAKQTEQWKGGVIPHASTWLNNARWEDEVGTTAPTVLTLETEMR